MTWSAASDAAPLDTTARAGTIASVARRRKPSEEEVKHAARLALASRHVKDRNDLAFTARTGAVIHRPRRHNNWRPTGWFAVHAFVYIGRNEHRVTLYLHDLPRSSSRCHCALGDGVHYHLDDPEAEHRFAEYAQASRLKLHEMIRILRDVGYHVTPPRDVGERPRRRGPPRRRRP
jgi:hypothetical protein